MDSFSSRLRVVVFAQTFLLCFATVGFGAETLWQKNLQVGLPDTPFVYADVTAGPRSELAFTTTSGKLVVCNVEGEILWTATGYSVFCNPPTAADLFPSEGQELLAINRQGQLTCFSSMGEELWQYRFPSGLDWCLTTVVAADLDRDGHIEILCGDMKGYFACLDRFGQEQWTYQVPGGFHCPPATGDINADGLLEVVITSPDGQLLVLNHAGDRLWSREIGYDNYSGPVIADLEGDGTPDILVGGKDSYLHCYSNEGEFKWKAPLEKETDSSIAVGNLRGDEKLEIVCMDLAGVCYGFDSDGNELWRQNFVERSRRPPLLADFNNDGKIEVLACGYFSNYVLLSGEGEILERVPGQATNGGATVVEYEGRLAVVIAGTGGTISCLSWQKEASATLPTTLWGTYRYDSRQTGVVQDTPSRAVQPTAASQSPLSLLTVLENHERTTRELNDTLQTLAQTEEQFSQSGVQLADLTLKKLDFERRLVDAENLRTPVPPVQEEETLRIVRQTVTTLESARRLVRETRALLPMLENAGTPRIVAWPTNPWWHIRSVGRESTDNLAAKEISVSLYRNEVESAAINLMNLESRACTVRVLAPSQMGEAEGPQLEVLEVISVPTEMEDYSDDALSQLNQAGTIHIAPGETRQVFLSISADQAKAGQYECTIQIAPIWITSTPTSIQLNVEVLDIDIEEADAPQMCTWGYVHSSVLKNHPQEAWRDRVEHGNNVIVLTSRYLPRVNYNERGELTSEPDFTLLGDFVEERPGALFLFHGYQGTLRGPDGHGTSSPAYKKAFTTWLHKLVAYLKGQNVGYDRFALYPVDEPGLRPGLVDIHIQYARLAREADPKVLMYTDPVDGAKMDDIQRMRDYVDIWCPNRNGFLLKDEEPRLDVMKANGHAVWTYECLHNAKHRPPLEYYRGLAWLTELRGLSGFGFWSYCTSSNTPWEFPSTRGHDYLLVYPGDGVVTSRRWEACRDGSEDIRALRILKQLIAEKTAQGVGAREIAEAEKIVGDATEELGRIGLAGTGSADMEILGKDGVTPVLVDTEWNAYRSHRKKIAEATRALRSTR